jgi:WD40 repeat protein
VLYDLAHRVGRHVVFLVRATLALYLITRLTGPIETLFCGVLLNFVVPTTEGETMKQNHRLLAPAVLAWLLPLAAPAGQWTVRAARPSAEKPCAAFSPDGRNLALWDGKRTLTIWDPATGKQRKTTTLALGRDESAEQVRYTPDGDLAVLLCRYKGFKSGPGWAREGTISACLWNISTGKRSPFIEVGYGGLAVCPKGALLAYRGGLWEMKTGKKLQKVALPGGLVYDILFSPDGKTVVYQISESLAQDFSLLLVVDAGTGKKRLQIGDIHPGNGRFYFGPRFSPDSKQLAFAEADRPALHLWVVAAGDQARRRIPLEVSERVVAFSPDARALISWDDRPNGVLHLWETQTGKQRHAVKVRGGIEAVLLSPDGKTVALVKGTAVEFRRLKD